MVSYDAAMWHCRLRLLFLRWKFATLARHDVVTPAAARWRLVMTKIKTKSGAFYNRFINSAIQMIWRTATVQKKIEILYLLYRHRVHDSSGTPLNNRIHLMMLIEERTLFQGNGATFQKCLYIMKLLVYMASSNYLGCVLWLWRQCSQPGEVCEVPGKRNRFQNYVCDWTSSLAGPLSTVYSLSPGPPSRILIIIRMFVQSLEERMGYWIAWRARGCGAGEPNSIVMAAASSKITRGRPWVPSPLGLSNSFNFNSL